MGAKLSTKLQLGARPAADPIAPRLRWLASLMAAAMLLIGIGAPAATWTVQTPDGSTRQTRDEGANWYAPAAVGFEIAVVKVCDDEGYPGGIVSCWILPVQFPGAFGTITTLEDALPLGTTLSDAEPFPSDADEPVLTWSGAEVAGLDLNFDCYIEYLNWVIDPFAQPFDIKTNPVCTGDAFPFFPAQVYYVDYQIDIPTVDGTLLVNTATLTSDLELVTAEYVTSVRAGPAVLELTMTDRPDPAVQEAAVEYDVTAIHSGESTEPVATGCSLTISYPDGWGDPDVFVVPDLNRGDNSRFVGTATVPVDALAGTKGTTVAVLTCDQGGDTVTEETWVEDPANTPPIAANDAYTETVPGDTPFVFDVLTNDTDADGDTLTIDAVTQGILGSVGIEDGGLNVLYTPCARCIGLQEEDAILVDSFTYTAIDDRGGSDEATVTVTLDVNDPPVARNDVASVAPGEEVDIDVLANDETQMGETLTITDVTQGTQGIATIVNGGTLIHYAAAADATGIDQFYYTIEDDRGGEARALVTVQFTANGVPIAVNDNAVVNVGERTLIDVLANDLDPDGDPLTIVEVTAALKGTTGIEGDFVVYQADEDADGVDSFQYTITDGRGGFATATVTVDIEGRNNAPIANSDVMEVIRNTLTPIDVLANDTDPDGDPLEIISVRQGSKGSTSISVDGDLVFYQPNPSEFGVDNFTYTISDGRGGTADATVSVLILNTDENVLIVALDATRTSFRNVDIAASGLVPEREVGFFWGPQRTDPGNLSTCEEVEALAATTKNSMFVQASPEGEASASVRSFAMRQCTWFIAAQLISDQPCLVSERQLVCR